MDDWLKRRLWLIGASPDEQPIRRARRPTSGAEEDGSAAKRRASLFGAWDMSAYPAPSTRAIRLIGASPDEQPPRRGRRFARSAPPSTGFGVGGPTPTTAGTGAWGAGYTPDEGAPDVTDDTTAGTLGSSGLSTTEVGPGDIHAPGWPLMSTTWSPTPAGTRPPPDFFPETERVYSVEGYVDVHFHLMWSMGWALTGELEATMAGLIGEMDGSGVGITILSATSYDFDTLPDIAQDVDKMVIQACQTSLPTTLGRGPRLLAFLCGGYCGWAAGDPLAEDYLDWAKGQIATYSFILGFGELIVHGHGYQHNGESMFLTKLYRIANSARLAVLVHWDIGAVDAYTGDDGSLYCAILEDGVWTQMEVPVTVAWQCQSNFDSFYRVAYDHPDVTFILAHCGAGPGTSGPYSTDPRKYMAEHPGAKASPKKATFDEEEPCTFREDMYDTWEGFLTAILDGDEKLGLWKLDNVYFDIAGMIGDFDYDSRLVDILKVFMTKHPDRFLFGMDKSTYDVEEGTYSTGDDGVDAYVYYLTDTSHFGLSAAAVEQIMRDNAVALLGLPTSA